MTDSLLDAEPFFELDAAGRYLPTPKCRGPWDPNSLHGRVIVGLLAYGVEREYADPALLPARLTVDMYRLPDFSPVQLITKVIRDGYRIKVIDVEMFSGEQSVGRASCQLLRRTENAPTKVWQPPNWSVPGPDEVAVPEGAGLGMGGMWAMRPIQGGFGSPGQKRVWISELRSLVRDVPLSPWMRVALAADFASPLANSGEGGLGYINTDVSLYLHRLPEAAWIGMETVNHQATDGVAIAECYLYDQQGLIGSSSVAALAQRRKA